MSYETVEININPLPDKLFCDSDGRVLDLQMRTELVTTGKRINIVAKNMPVYRCQGSLPGCDGIVFAHQNLTEMAVKCASIFRRNGDIVSMLAQDWLSRNL